MSRTNPQMPGSNFGGALYQLILELRELRDELYDLEQVKESLEKDLRRAEEALDTERLAVQELTIVYSFDNDRL